MLQLSQLLCLVNLQPAIGFAPPVIGLIGHPDYPADERSGLPLADEHFRFAQLADDLIGCKYLLGHFDLPLLEYMSFSGSFLTNFWGQVFGGRSLSYG